MTTDSPNSKFDHVYVVIRLDEPAHGIPFGIGQITLTKVFFSKEKAIQEVERLNSINSDKFCKYFVQISRLVP
jgi:hypothetical protein